MKILFLSQSFLWPLRTGSSVHSGNVMKAMAKLGHEVTLVTEHPIEETAAKHWLEGVSTRTLSTHMASVRKLRNFSYLEKRCARYVGVREELVDQWAESVSQEAPDGVVAIGIPALVVLGKIPSSIARCWYLADDPMLAMWCGTDPWSVRDFLSKLAYQRILRGNVDSVWVVSNRDRKWSRFFGGWKSVDTVPNGVDTEFFNTVSNSQRKPSNSMLETPSSSAVILDSDNRGSAKRRCGFWGNLGFPPNVEALEYFLSGPWLSIRALEPEAQLVVAGANASEYLEARMKGTPGVQYLGEVDSIAEAFSEIPIAIFPFRTGAGIKNKVLEAAAMGKAILISPTAANGLCGDFNQAIQVVSSDSQWTAAIGFLFKNPEVLRDSGTAARRWVLENHTWDQSAKIALEAIDLIRNKS